MYNADVAEMGLNGQMTSKIRNPQKSRCLAGQLSFGSLASRHRARYLLIEFAALILLAVSIVGGGQAPVALSFAARSAQLSEAGGYFDTDNLISNERSYQHVVPALREPEIAGGAYIGVGPDQNFSYIAQLRPSVAFIIDIRRNNLLLHLLFKALFQLSETRVDYLCLLFGKPLPEPSEDWRRADINRLIKYIDNTNPSQEATKAMRAKVDAVITKFGIPLSESDLQTIDRYHRTFITSGVQLKFETFGRGPRIYYPTYRDLLLETDLKGHRWNFLNSEDDFQFVRALEKKDLVIPVIGDLSGPSALVKIGRMMSQSGWLLSALYTSNVEFYLFRDGTFPRFVDNLSHLPHSEKSLIIRAVFAGASPSQLMPGYASTSIVQRVDDLLGGYARGRFRDYRELTFGRY